MSYQQDISWPQKTIMSNGSQEFPYGHFRSELALQTGVLLFQIVLPLLLVLGTIGNTLSMIVLSRKSMQKSVSSTYLFGLSVADLLVLYVCLMRDWIRYMTADIRNLCNFTCKVQYWLHYALLDFSVWLLTGLTVDRFISTFRPLSGKIAGKKWHAKCTVMCALVIDLIIHSHFLFGMEVKLKQDKAGYEYSTCEPNSTGYARFFHFYWHYIDLALFSIIPFFILSFSNIYIIYRVFKNKQKLKGHTVSTKLTNQDKKTLSMAKLLVALNIIFIVSTAPICIYLVCRPYTIPKDIPSGVQEEDPWYAFVKILMYMNNTVNFILYCVSGSKFRRELKRLFHGLIHKYQSVTWSSTSQKSTRSTRSTPASLESSI